MHTSREKFLICRWYKTFKTVQESV